jgi:fluoroquinolone transport system ATP-binding protein
MLIVQNLNFSYHSNGENTLKGLDFSITKGEIFGFLGPSGAGKSTTQKILLFDGRLFTIHSFYQDSE